MDWFNSQNAPSCEVRPPLSVTAVSRIIERLLDDRSLQDIDVQGEITNYTRHSRGHRYFSLSEKGGGSTTAVIKCVMWSSDAGRLAFEPEDGIEVVVTGSVRVYAPHGVYQFQVKKMARAGLGEKYLLLEKWKKELAQEGCFAAGRKRPLPAFPARIGVVTSETGAVIHDIRTVIERRFPVHILISPTAVQGEGAHVRIARAISQLHGLVDVVIVARGGGSFEDLFEFNYPEVVRAIASCPVPVVSAIGHEVDVTLADLAADMRAATPSAAAELVVPDQKDLRERLTGYKNQMDTALFSRLDRARTEISDLRDRLRPRRLARMLEEKKQNTADLFERLERSFLTHIERERLLLMEMNTAIESKNPLAVLKRGYCIAEKNGRAINSVDAISNGDRMQVRFRDGRSDVLVERVEHD